METVQLKYPQDYSIYTQELLARPPAWMLRWGSSLIFIILMLIVLLSYVVKYPDVINAKATITTPVPPIAIVAQQSGKLHWLKTPHDPDMKKGESIAVIETATDLNDINTLKDWLQNYKDNKQVIAELPSNLRLGEVQQPFSHFQKTLKKFYFYQSLNPTKQKLLHAKQKQQQFQHMQQQFAQQQAILKDERILINRKLQRFIALKNKNLVAETKIDEINISLLSNLRQQQQIATEIDRTNVSLTNLAINITEYKLTNQQKLEDFNLNLLKDFQALISSIAQWEKQYLLNSPIAGKLTFSKFWSEHQFVKVNEEVVTVVPNKDQPIIARVKMPPANSGKVRVGQKIIIKLEGYPFQEYGQIESQVGSISLVPRKGLYTIEAQLPNPLVTSSNKTLNFNQEMQGKAEIVTEDLRLIERFFYQILKLVKA